jgi:hypothetical protein
MADLLGHEDDAVEYRNMAVNIKDAFNVPVIRLEVAVSAVDAPRPTRGHVLRCAECRIEAEGGAWTRRGATLAFASQR